MPCRCVICRYCRRYECSMFMLRTRRLSEARASSQWIVPALPALRYARHAFRPRRRVSLMPFSPPATRFLVCPPYFCFLPFLRRKPPLLPHTRAHAAMRTMLFACPPMRDYCQAAFAAPQLQEPPRQKIDILPHAPCCRHRQVTASARVRRRGQPQRAAHDRRPRHAPERAIFRAPPLYATAGAICADVAEMPRLTRWRR